MNHIYKVKYNRATNTSIAVSELSSRHTSGKSSKSITTNSIIKGLFSFGVLAGGLLSSLPSVAIAEDKKIVKKENTRNICAEDETFCQKAGSDSPIGIYDTSKVVDAIVLGKAANTVYSNSIVLGTSASIVKALNSRGYDSVQLNSSVPTGTEIAIGENAQVFGSGIAFGRDSLVIGTIKQKTRRGRVITTIDSASYAFGNRAFARHSESIAFGGDTIAFNSLDMAVGSSAKARGGYENLELGASIDPATAFGAAASANGQGAIAFGISATAGSDIDIEDKDLYNGGNYKDGYNVSPDSAKGIDDLERSKANFAVAIGGNTEARGEESISLGAFNKVTGTRSVALGSAEYSFSPNSNDPKEKKKKVVTPHSVTGDNSFSIGNDNTIKTDSTYALGSKITKTVADSVFLGDESAYVEENNTTKGINKSYTSDTVYVVKNNYNGMETSISRNFAGGDSVVGVVSVGGKSDNGKLSTRRIQNVAPGFIANDSTDAINGSQLYATNELLGHLADNLKNILGGDAAIHPDGSISYGGTGGKNGNGTPHDENGVGGTGKDNNTIDKAINHNYQGWNAKVAKASGSNGKSETSVDVNTGDQIQPKEDLTFNAGNNIALKQDANNLTISTVEQPLFTGISLGNSNDSLENGAIKAGTPTITSTNDGNIKLTKAPEDPTTLSTQADTFNDGSEVKLTNLAKGSLDHNSEDAINGSQLYALADDLAKNVIGGTGTKFDPTAGKISGFSFNLRKPNATDKNNPTVSNVNNVFDALTGINENTLLPLTFAGDMGENVTRQLNTTLNIKGGATGDISTGNIKVTANGTDELLIQLAKRLSDLESIQLGTGDKGPRLSADGDNLKLSKGNTDTPVKITNVAAGTDDNDAVNLKQLKDEIGKAIAKNGWNIAVEGDTTPASGTGAGGSGIGGTDGETATGNGTGSELAGGETGVGGSGSGVNGGTGVDGSVAGGNGAGTNGGSTQPVDSNAALPVENGNTVTFVNPNNSDNAKNLILSKKKTDNGVEVGIDLNDKIVIGKAKTEGDNEGDNTNNTPITIDSTEGKISIAGNSAGDNPTDGDATTNTPDAVALSKGDNGEGILTLSGKAGENNTPAPMTNISLDKGVGGVKDSEDTKKNRLTYTNGNENGQPKVETIATLNDGLKFKGNDGEAVAVPLNETLNLTGGITDSNTLATNSDKVSSANLGVRTKTDEDGTPTGLEVVMKNNLDLTEKGSVTTGRTTLDNSGIKISNKTTLNGDGLTITGGPAVTKEGINAGDKAITNVASVLADTNKIEDIIDEKKLNQAVTAKDLKKSVWSLTTETDVDTNKPANKVSNQTVTVKHGRNTKVSTVTKDDQGNYSYEIDVTGLPMEYLDAEGNSLVNYGGKFFTESKNDQGEITLKPATPAKVKIVSDKPMQLTNVAAGNVTNTSTDAVNGSQLYALGDVIAGDHIEYEMDENGNPTKVKLKDSTFDYLTSADGEKNGDLVAENDPDTPSNVVTAMATLHNEGTKYVKVNSEADRAKAIGDESIAIGGNATANAPASIAIGYNATVTDSAPIGSVALGAGSVAGKAHIGPYSLSGGAVAGKTGPDTQVVSVGTKGNERQIQNVAPGVVSATSTDAVNGSQLHDVKQVVNQHGNKINQLEGDLDGVGASAGALASLPQSYLPGKSLIAVGVGSQGSERAIAVGISRISDNGRIIVKFDAGRNTRGNTTLGAGVGFIW